MIFDTEEDFDDVTDTQDIAVSAHRLLGACAEEAGRLASAIARLDQDVAMLLQDVSKAGVILQHIDLVRQEAEGLAAVLNLVAIAPTPDHMVDPQTLASILKLRAQHGRIAAS